MPLLDLQIVRGQGSATTTQLTPGAAISGTPKLMTKFAQLFLRDIDTVRGRGTDFSRLCRTGGIRTTADAVLQFTAAVQRIFLQLGNQSALPAEEQLTRAELLSTAISGDQIQLSVRLHTPNGTTTFPLPVSRI